VDVIARAACSLLPGVPKVSTGIAVRSIVGEFLEHSRIWRFENGGEPEWLIGSGDLMDRNLDRRIEAFVPIDDPEARRELDEIIATLLADDRRAWSLAADGRWQRVERLEGKPGQLDAQQRFKVLAQQRSLEAAAPHRPHAGLGSLEPWA
jgi:polyphosphate kinase